MPAKNPPRWSERLADTAFATGPNVFMAFVAGGCTYIILAKLAGVGPFYVTFAPVGTMVAYALLIHLSRNLKLRDDQSGDNLYYMGFLFTLTSLGVSLYQFNAGRAAEEIVQNFGIAIASTITGIGLRVLFNQMRRDPVEVERMMRLELAEAARRVRRELDSAVVEFAYHRRCAQQSAAESFKHATEKFDELVGKFLNSLEDITVKLAAPIEAASRRSGEAIGEASQAIGARLADSASRLSAANEALSGRAGAISQALAEVAANLNALETPQRIVEVRVEPLAEAFVHAAERLAAQTERQTVTLAAAVERANAATESSTDLVAKLRQELAAAAATNRATLEAITTMIQAMAEVIEEFRFRAPRIEAID